jgi:AcrR family transcriptional regulator
VSQTDSATFQRARRPEQREQRRQAILDEAGAMLRELPIADISLRELSRRVGLSKSNVVRYFETREAVFLELLDRAYHEWLDALERELPFPARHGSTPHPPSPPLSAVLARTLAARPVLCELWSALATVLERNVSMESIRAFKLSNRSHQLRLAQLVKRCDPDLADDTTQELAALCTVLVAGLWPFANPSPTVRAAIDDPRLAASRIDFTAMLGRDLDLVITGLLRTPGAPGAQSP